MRAVACLLSLTLVMLLSVAARADHHLFSHLFYDITAEEENYVVGEVVPTWDNGAVGWGEPGYFAWYGGFNSLPEDFLVVEDWTDPGTGNSMPGKALSISVPIPPGTEGRPESPNQDVFPGFATWGHGQGEPATTGKVVVQYEFMFSTANPEAFEAAIRTRLSPQDNPDPGASSDVPFAWFLRQEGGDVSLGYDDAGFPAITGITLGEKHVYRGLYDLDAETYEILVDDVSAGVNAFPEGDWVSPTRVNIDGPSWLGGQVVIDNFVVAQLIPEPATMGLAWLGLAGLLAIRRRR